MKRITAKAGPYADLIDWQNVREAVRDHAGYPVPVLDVKKKPGERVKDDLHALLNESPWEQWRSERYASFDSGAGKDFESGKLSLADLHALALTQGEPKQVSGKQERYENLLNQYLQR